MSLAADLNNILNSSALSSKHLKTIRYLVSGRVQGVGFRYFTRQAAKQVGVTGWVKNRIDGTVEALARGSVEQLNLFEHELNQGPSFSYVERVQRLETEESEGDSIHQFIIRH